MHGGACTAVNPDRVPSEPHQCCARRGQLFNWGPRPSLLRRTGSCQRLRLSERQGEHSPCRPATAASSAPHSKNAQTSSIAVFGFGRALRTRVDTTLPAGCGGRVQRAVVRLQLAAATNSTKQLPTNHRRLLWSKDTVVNVAEKSERDFDRCD
jgi:hypothetical protein